MQKYQPRELAAIDVNWTIEMRIPLDEYHAGLVARATFVMILCAAAGNPDRSAIAAEITKRGIEEGELSSWHSNAEGMPQSTVIDWIAKRGIRESDVVSMTIERVMFADETIASASIY